jgi:P27 family predicted phage terminase small subunit
MRPGPKPTPTTLKLVRNNPGKRKLPENEPRLPRQLPTCPERFDETRRRAWSDLAQELLGMGVLTAADGIALELAASLLARYREADEHLQAEKQILTSKEGGLYQSPWGGLSSNLEKKLWNALAAFGMSPADRSRVQVSAPPAESAYEQARKKK